MENEKTFLVLDYDQTLSNKNVKRAFWREFAKNTIFSMRICQVDRSVLLVRQKICSLTITN